MIKWLFFFILFLFLGEGHLMRRVDSLEKTLMLRGMGVEEKGMTEDEMAGWHHRLEGRESGWTPGVGDGQGGLACCGSWCRKELGTTEQLNWTELSPRNVILQKYLNMTNTFRTVWVWILAGFLRPTRSDCYKTPETEKYQTKFLGIWF